MLRKIKILQWSDVLSRMLHPAALLPPFRTHARLLGCGDHDASREMPQCLLFVLFGDVDARKTGCTALGVIVVGIDIWGVVVWSLSIRVRWFQSLGRAGDTSSGSGTCLGMKVKMAVRLRSLCYQNGVMVSYKFQIVCLAYLPSISSCNTHIDAASGLRGAADDLYHSF